MEIGLNDEGEIRAHERTVSTTAPSVKKPPKELSTATAFLTSQGNCPTCTYCQ